MTINSEADENMKKLAMVPIKMGVRPQGTIWFERFYWISNRNYEKLIALIEAKKNKNWIWAVTGTYCFGLAFFFFFFFFLVRDIMGCHIKKN